MTDDAMPDWMEEDEDGMCDASIQPEHPVQDDEIDDLVLVAGVDPDDEEAKEARRREYARLFPGEAVKRAVIEP